MNRFDMENNNILNKFLFNKPKINLNFEKKFEKSSLNSFLEKFKNSNEEKILNQDKYNIEKDYNNLGNTNKKCNNKDNDINEKKFPKILKLKYISIKHKKKIKNFTKINKKIVKRKNRKYIKMDLALGILEEKNIIEIKDVINYCKTKDNYLNEGDKKICEFIMDKGKK